jgi:putative spermidine/putrescine transport system permease protein
VTGVLLATVAFLIAPVVLTLVASFAREWTGVLPSGFVTVRNWEVVLGLADTVGSQRSMGWDPLFTLPVAGGLTVAAPAELFYSVSLALGGVAINLVVGVPVAYAVSRYEFAGREWVEAIAVLPLVPGVVLGVAFLRAYPTLSGTSLGLVVGYSLLKLPFMVMAVRSEFDSMPLRHVEESARSLGASWPRTFLTVVVPSARRGIVSGAIICWTLAAAEFNFSYVVWAKGTQPLALFLQRHISNSGFTRAAAAVSMFFCIVVAITLLLQAVGTRGFDTRGRGA